MSSSHPASRLYISSYVSLFLPFLPHIHTSKKTYLFPDHFHLHFLISFLLSHHRFGLAASQIYLVFFKRFFRLQAIIFFWEENHQTTIMKSISSLAVVTGLATLVASQNQPQCTCAATETVTFTDIYRPTQTVYDHTQTITVTQALSTITVIDHVTVTNTVPRQTGGNTEAASSITLTSNAPSHTSNPPYTNTRPNYTYRNSSSGYVRGTGTGYSTGGYASSSRLFHSTGTAIRPSHSVGTGYSSTRGYASSTGKSWPSSTSPPSSIPTVVVGLEKGAVLKFLPPFLPHVPAGSTVHFDFRATNHTLTESTFDAPCVKSVFRGSVDTNFQNVNKDDIPELKPFDLVVDSEAPRFFYCKQQVKTPRSHCQKGMVFAINVDEQTFNQFEENAEATVPTLPKIKGRDIAAWVFWDLLSPIFFLCFYG